METKNNTSKTSENSKTSSRSAASLKKKPATKPTLKLRRTGAYYPSAQFTAHPKRKKK